MNLIVFKGESFCKAHTTNMAVSVAVCDNSFMEKFLVSSLRVYNALLPGEPYSLRPFLQNKDSGLEG